MDSDGGSAMTAGAMTAGAGGRVREVDALRGIGAAIILAFHYLGRYPVMFPDARHVGLTFDHGYVGVILFFALSGFSIRFSFRSGAGVADFVVSRFARLYPAYWAAMAVTLAVQAVAQVPLFAVPPGAVVVNLTMLQSFARMPSVDGVYWTLGVELAFYACMAALWRFGLWSRIERLLPLWLLAGLLPTLWPAIPEPVVQATVLRFVPFFAIGLVAHRVWRGERRWRQQVPLVALGLLVVAATQEPVVVPMMALVQAAFVALTGGLLRPLCRAPVLALGAISYPLYLVHQHVGMTVMRALDGAGVPPWAGLAAAVALAIGLGTAIHLLVERRVGDRVLAAWRARGAHWGRLRPT